MSSPPGRRGGSTPPGWMARARSRGARPRRLRRGTRGGSARSPRSTRARRHLTRSVHGSGHSGAAGWAARPVEVVLLPDAGVADRRRRCRARRLGAGLARSWAVRRGPVQPDYLVLPDRPQWLYRSAPRDRAQAAAAGPAGAGIDDGAPPVPALDVTGHADVADAASLNRSGTPRCDVVARLGVAFGEGQAGHEVVLRCAVPVPLVVLDVDDVAGSCSLLSRRPRIIINHSVDIR